MVGQEEFITNNFAFFDAIPDRDHSTPPALRGGLRTSVGSPVAL